ncbi:hypothetical protein FB451DRAFT_1195993 [Mycena latifolia]|nr:hypothetical protein FB451DRAFT_1195993 [Mycena latifolia]
MRARVGGAGGAGGGRREAARCSNVRVGGVGGVGGGAEGGREAGGGTPQRRAGPAENGTWKYCHNLLPSDAYPGLLGGFYSYTVTPPSRPPRDCVAAPLGGAGKNGDGRVGRNACDVERIGVQVEMGTYVRAEIAAMSKTLGRRSGSGIAAQNSCKVGMLGCKKKYRQIANGVRGEMDAVSQIEMDSVENDEAPGSRVEMGGGPQAELDVVLKWCRQKQLREALWQL